MFSYLKGILVSVYPTHVIIEINGIGYHVLIPCHLTQLLPTTGDSIQLHTTFVIREFSQAIYGFLDLQERDVFEILLSLSGIGPKLALSLLGHLRPEELQRSVMQQDYAALCRVPGVGKKTAERLVVELKDKLSDLIPTSLPNLSIQVIDPSVQCIQDAIMALVNLGYHQNIAQKVVKQTIKEQSENIDLASLITLSLKKI